MIDGRRRSRLALWLPLKGKEEIPELKPCIARRRRWTLPEQSEAYTSGFAGKNNALRLDNTRFYEEKAEIHRLVRAGKSHRAATGTGLSI
jgi:hypothetical protein